MIFENLLWESAFRRAKFCEILSHSVRYGMYGNTILFLQRSIYIATFLFKDPRARYTK